MKLFVNHQMRPLSNEELIRTVDNLAPELSQTELTALQLKVEGIICARKA